MLVDLCYALRRLRKSPGFTLTAVVTLALGIGATTAIFTLVQQVMLQSLPATQPDRLWRIGDQARCCNWGGYSQDGNDDDEPADWSLFPWEAYKLFRANTAGFEDLAALQAGNATLGVRPASSPAPPDTANGQYVSGNFFRTLGVSAWRGRLLTDADDQEGAPPVAVMSFHDFAAVVLDCLNDKPTDFVQKFFGDGRHNRIWQWSSGVVNPVDGDSTEVR